MDDTKIELSPLKIRYLKKFMLEFENVKIANEDIFKDNEYLRGSFDKAIKESKSLKFGLICKNNNSFFYIIEQLSTEEGFNSNKTTLIFANYMGEIYQEKDTLFSQSAFLGNNIFEKKINLPFL